MYAAAMSFIVGCGVNVHGIFLFFIMGGHKPQPCAPRWDFQYRDLVQGKELENHILMAIGSHLPASWSASLMVVDRYYEPNVCVP